jgi:fucose 4-O-acetylase-like acetyltransferase
MEKRLDYVDIAKGIGILLVVCSHSDALPLMWLLMGMFVPVFYFCSGYTFSCKGTLSEAFVRHFRKLFVPYLFFNALLFLAFGHFSLREVAGVCYSRYSLFPLDISPNVKFLTSGNYPMWFLTSMIVSYLLFYVIVYHERYRWWILSAYAVATVAFMYCPILLPWSIDTAFLTAVFMYTGMLARRHNAMSWNIWWIVLLAFLYVGIHCIAGDINLSVRMYGTSVAFYFLLGSVGSFLLLWLSRFLEHTLAGSLFTLLGRHSLTIFSVEMAFIVPAKSLCEYVLPGFAADAPAGSEWTYVAGLVEIVFALMGGWLLSVVLHKSRFLSRLLQF